MTPYDLVQHTRSPSTAQIAPPLVPPHPIFVRIPPVRQVRRPTVVHVTAIPPFSPIAVPRPLVIRPTLRPRRIPSLIQPVPHHLMGSVVVNGPMPYVLVVSRAAPRGAVTWGRRAPLLYRATVVAPEQPISGVNPPTPGPGPMPPDLVSACIAWLRLTPAVVAAFGDAVGTEKFFSDVAVRGTDPPWLAFSEPDEDKGFETEDQTGATSSLAVGVLACEVISGGGPNGKRATASSPSWWPKRSTTHP